MVEFPPSRERHELGGFATTPLASIRHPGSSVSLAVLMVGARCLVLGQAKASPSDLGGRLSGLIPPRSTAVICVMIRAEFAGVGSGRGIACAARDVAVDARRSFLESD